MRPKSQRSRACQQCRERRVKCDETPGFCNQCRRLGLDCSGPIQGSVIIDMTDKVTKPRARKKKEKPAVVIREDRLEQQQSDHTSKPQNSARTVPIQFQGLHGAIPGPEPESSRKDSATSPLPVILAPKQNPPHAWTQNVEGEDAIVAIRTRHKLPMLYQPSQADSFDSAFISHFVELNKGVRSYQQSIPWITHLPGLHTKAQTIALKLSIRAASMAFYAKLHGDAPILVDSYKWYTISLNSQRIALSKFNKKTVPTDEECLVPIILGLYEVYAGTTATSVFSHLTAATKIVEMRGPRNCSSGVSSPLFRALRVSDAHKAVVFNQPSVFSTPEWMTIPFLITPKNAFQYLADILLAIPACIGMCEMNCSLSGFFTQKIPSSVNLRTPRERAAELLHELDEWARRNPHLCVTVPVSQITTPDMMTPISPSSTASKQALMLPDSFVALTAATYKAIHLILTLIIHKLSPKTSISSVLNHTSASPHDIPEIDLIARATQHAKDILDISGSVESTHPVGFDFLRSVFPLSIVGILGPSVNEQNLARQMLSRWGEKRGLPGLCGSWVDI